MCSDVVAQLNMTQGELDWLRGMLAPMLAMYAQEDRVDWFNADDNAIEVATWLAGKLGIRPCVLDEYDRMVS